MGLGIRTAIKGMGKNWRVWFARRYLVVSVGDNCDLRPGCVIECGKPVSGQNYQGIILGNHVTLCAGVVLTTDSYKPESGIKIGNSTSFNRNTMIQGSGGVTIGDNVLVGPGVIIWSSGHEYSGMGPIRGQPLTFAPVVIEDDVWIGAGAIILPGVTIGKGSVVGAGSVVRKNVPPMAVVVGNPSVEINRRE